MTTEELMNAALQLIRRQYTLSIDTTSINVSDPVMCYSGSEKWVEYEMVKLETYASVQRFISARE
jgi:hypothetical protein